MPQEGALFLLGLNVNIAEASRLLYPLISIGAPTYNKVIDWLQFVYTGDQLGVYVDPGYTELEFNSISEGGGLFDLAIQQLQNL